MSSFWSYTAWSWKKKSLGVILLEDFGDRTGGFRLLMSSLGFDPLYILIGKVSLSGEIVVVGFQLNLFILSSSRELETSFFLKGTSFVWTAVLGFILNINNLGRRSYLLSNSCCVCHKAEMLVCSFETVIELWGLLSIFLLYIMLASNCSSIFWEREYPSKRVLKAWKATPCGVLCSLWMR